MVFKNLEVFKSALIKFFILGFAITGVTGLSHVSADAADDDYKIKSLSYEEYLEQTKKEDAVKGLESTGKQILEKDIKRNSLVNKSMVSSAQNVNYQVIEGDFSSLGEEKTYHIDIDYTDIDTAAIALVKTGKSDVSITISDVSGELKNFYTYEGCPRLWYFIDKPSLNATVVSYTISVKAKSYDSDASGFRVMAGDKKDIESMISGMENAVWLEYYTEKKKNQFFTRYTPNREESWYRFTSSGTDVFTVLNDHPEIRFRICDVDTLYTWYDSNDSENGDAHRTNFCQSYNCAEKARITLTLGKDYYLVVYPVSTISAQPLVTDSMNITVGKPNMGREITTVYATTKLTVPSSTYSPVANIIVGDNGETIPKTAVIDWVERRNNPGALLSELPYWRVKYPGARAWLTSGECEMRINIGYTKDGTNNKNINGIWQISEKASSSASPLTVTPGIYMMYYYELGD
ncbi:hypothetical protein D7V86_15630 [bacterium D16-51]|nr:hypothetical protein D7V96_15600 [bacterium D16-59]RKI58388.1 hypothetical protein D7V86_15630 [bacterium D16-51]